MKVLKLSILLSLLFLSGCIGTIIETTTDVAIAVVKIPFKVGGAIVDVVKGDDDKEDDFSEKEKTDKPDHTVPENNEDYRLE